MSKVLDESGENGQLPSTSNTQVINEDGENGQSPSTSNTKVINENGENGQSSSASSTMINEDGENKQSSSTSNIKVMKAPPKLSRREKLLVLLRVVIMLFIEIALPLILYYVLKDHLGDVRALIISGVPPFLVVIYGFIRNRRVDVLGAMMVITSIVGIILTLLKNDPRFFLLRESVMTGTVGITFLITLIPIKIGSFKMRPIIFYFARDMTTGGTFGKKSQNPDDDISESWDRYWDSYAIFRQGFIVLTIVWGVGLLSEAPVRVVIVFKAPTVERAVFWSNIVTYSWLSVLILFNSIYSNMFKKRCKREIPKAEAAAAAAANQTSV